MQQDKKLAIKTLVKESNQLEIRQAIILLIDSYWNNADSHSLQKAYDKLKSRQTPLFNLFGWIITTCTLWDVHKEK